MERLNFHKTIKLHKFCSTDDVRPAMGYIHFENGYAYASDGQMLVRARVTDCCNIEDEDMLQKLEGKNLHCNLYKRLLEFDRITEITDEAIIAGNKEFEAHFKFNQEVNYVKAQRIFDQHAKSERTPVNQIKLNPKNIAKVREVMPAITSGGVVFEFGNEGSAVIIRYDRSEIYKDITVAIMPMIIED